MKRVLWPLLVLSASGCFYGFSPIEAGTSGGSSGTTGTPGTGTGGSASGGSSGGSTGSRASTGGSSGSSGQAAGGTSGSSTGATTGAGSSTGGLCSRDAGWPTNCTELTIVSPLMDIAYVAATPLGGGAYLVSENGDDTEPGLQAYVVTGPTSPGDGGYLEDDAGGSGFPDSETAIVPTDGGQFVLLTFDPVAPTCGGQTDAQLDCASPWRTPPDGGLTYGTAGACDSLDALQAASDSAGRVAVSVTASDNSGGSFALYAVGAAPGLCPAALAPLPQGAQAGGVTALPGGSFAFAGVSGVTLDVWFRLADGGFAPTPLGGSLVAQAPLAVSLAPAGGSVVAVVSDGLAGAEVYAPMDGGLLAAAALEANACDALDGNQYLAPYPMAACGPDCALVAWMDYPGCDAGGGPSQAPPSYQGIYQAHYAFVGADGCVRSNTTAAFQTSQDANGQYSDWAPVAVASQSGSAVVVFGENASSGAKLRVLYCAP